MAATGPSGVKAGARERDYFRLRAEWLRFKNHVFDNNTGLPTLAAVLDDVRRLMEERGSLTLLYLNLDGDGGFEALHGWHAHDEALRAFARALQALRGDGLLAPRDILSVAAVRSDEFLLFLGGGPTGDAAAAERQSAQVCGRLQETFALQLLHTAAAPPEFSAGHALLLRDPMRRAESALHAALDAAMFMSLRRRTSELDRRERELDELIRTRRVTTLYQPILDLRDLSVLGHEVFSRGQGGGALADAETLFALAERSGRILDFERLCRAHALGSARRHLAAGAKLFLNTSASALRDPELCGGGLRRAAAGAGLLPAELVLEVTERVAVEQRRSYRDALQELKADGFGIAIDDMGAGYSSLQALVEIEPDYMKFDVSLVRDIDRSLIKRSLLETLVDLSERIGAEVIAEGIEAESEFATLRELGVKLGQGRYLAPPRLVPDADAVAP